MKRKGVILGLGAALCIGGTCLLRYAPEVACLPQPAYGEQSIFRMIQEIFTGEPEEVRELRNAVWPEQDEGRLEYYYQQLNPEERRCYREMLDGIRDREEEFYLTLSDTRQIDRVYHALLKDHPEVFWVHNREPVYTTTYGNSEYCLFSPGYTYTDEEVAEVLQAMEDSYGQVLAMIPEGADTYETIKTVYTYLIDYTDYAESEHDQNIAGVFWKKNAVCAGYAGAVQYILERMGIPCIYVEGSALGSDKGHAWNIVQIEGQYYYVDVTNGDQPEFLEGDAAQMAEHKTIIYDYLCPFPQEYEICYTPSDEFAVPDCTATDRNFYILNQGCFDYYERGMLYDYCCMRLNFGAAVVRFKFSGQAAFDQAIEDMITNGSVENVAMYYMQMYGLGQVEYHYGILEHLKTIYFMF